METESFENKEVAAVLNHDFISIKVDREEHPDVDRVYIAFVHATTGSGGWPMSVWLTPEWKPFFGGTCFPPTSRSGRPGFTEILKKIAWLWTDDPRNLVESAETLTERLRRSRETELAGENGPDAVVAGPETLAQGVDQFAQAFDATYGGFGLRGGDDRTSDSKI